MNLIKRAIFLVMMTAAGSLFAQAGVSLETEIQNIEREAGRQDISAQERHDALVRLARLRQLSGDIEGAARNWLEAAAAIPGTVDDDALLSCAFCLAAMGEWDRAAAVLAPLLSKLPRARFLNISINAIKTGNVSGLSTIADSGEYSGMKSEIYFMLWRTSSAETAETWRRRLTAEFPQTPEGRLAAASASALIVKPSPFWFFLGGLDSLPLMEGEQPVSRPTAPPVERPAPVTTSPPAERATPVTVLPTAERPASVAAVLSVVSQPPASQNVTQTPAAQTARLQTGIFNHHDYAQAQMTRLRQAGFSPSIEQRGEMWAVTVPAGADQSRAIRELREAGFDSFPIR
jgi:cell division septation protein DedD